MNFFLFSLQTMKIHTIAEPNSVHILWQIPQYVVMSAGEVSILKWNFSRTTFLKNIKRIFLFYLKIMFSVTGLEFSFTQAPSSMKSVLQAFWLLTVTFGNIFVVIIAKIKLFDSQSGEFFLYAVLMAMNVALFIFLAMKYKYRTVIEDVENDENAARNANVINLNGNPPLNQTFTTDGLGPTTAAIQAGAISLNPRTSLSNVSSNGSEKIDSSPKCLKRASNGKNGVDNYGYTDI